MPRQSRGRSSSSSRAAPRPAAAAAPAQTRGAHTAAVPAGYAPGHAPAPPAAASAASGTAKPPGIMAQMAATAGSVAIGSTIGHGLSNMLFGGGGAAAEGQQAPPAQNQQSSNMSCEIPAKDFTLCLEKADMASCTYYLEQLKACQAAAAPY